MPIELNINNVVKTVDVEPDTPLLWVLRDTLNLHGTKYGCGMSFVRSLHRPRQRPGRPILRDPGLLGRGQADHHH